MKQLIDFFPVLLFPNRLQEKIAERICYTNGLLWRGDSTRMVLYKTPFQLKGQYEYDWKAFHITEPIQHIEMEPSGVLRLFTSTQQKNIPPVKNLNEHQKVKAFRIPSCHTEVEFDAKKMTRTLLMMKTDLDKHRIKETESTIKVDTSTKQIALDGIKSSFSLNIEIKKSDNNAIYYAYPLFNDLMMNARGVTQKVNIKSYQPFYSLIRYHEQAWALITHKRR